MSKFANRIVCLAFAAFLAASTGCKSNNEQSGVEAKKAALKEKLAEWPSDVVYAASAHLRVVDTARREVISKTDIQKDIRSVVFSPDGDQAFVGAADGVRRFDAKSHTLVDHLTKSPARSLLLDETGKKLFVLEHDVIIHEGGRREPTPFRLATIDVSSGEVLGTEEIGHRVMFARPATGRSTHHLVVTEVGIVRVGAAPMKLAEGEVVDLKLTTAARVRPEVAIHGTKAFVPVESDPSRVVAIDLTSGQSQIISLERAMTIRGLAVSPDGETLLVSTGRELLSVGIKTGAIQQSIELPAPHLGAQISSDGNWAYLAQMIDGQGGAIGVVNIESFQYAGKIHLADISPWSFGVKPNN